MQLDTLKGPARLCGAWVDRMQTMTAQADEFLRFENNSSLIESKIIDENERRMNARDHRT